jgi:uncharacterized protein
MQYRTEVRTLFSSLSASRTVTGQLELSDVVLGEQAYRFEEPIAFEITLTNTGAGIVADGWSRARALTSCVRCLCDMALDVEAPVEGFYVLPGKERDLPEEQEVEIVADDMTIDLAPAIEQSLIVELPYAPVHDDACRGICASCGADLNVETCDCAGQPPAGRFDVLRSLDLDE